MNEPPHLQMRRSLERPSFDGEQARLEGQLNHYEAIRRIAVQEGDRDLYDWAVTRCMEIERGLEQLYGVFD